MSENEVETQPESVAEQVETQPEGIAEQVETESAPAAEPVAGKAKTGSGTAGKSAASAKKAEKTKKATNIDEIMAVIKNMTVLDLAELVKTLETEFGVSASAPMMAAAAPVAEAAAPDEEQTEFTVTLKDIGPNKISVIRAVRELTSLGLKESKDLVEGAPKPVKERVTKEEAAAAKGKLEEAGATADIT